MHVLHLTAADPVIVNLTEHQLTSEQRTVGVKDPPPDIAERIKTLLVFRKLPSTREIERRAQALAACAVECVYETLPVEGAMIGGAPWLMAPLECALTARGITPVYAFSHRRSVELSTDDGNVFRQTIFHHEGFIYPQAHH